ncbi:MAG: hypothetical protein IH608_11255 [Proteobacteria bacterium]|nr:hypothetical protein [Pseudomonadota bacterium]
MVKRVVGLALLFLAVVPVRAAESPSGAVADYEARLEEISKEVAAIRRELESLVAEVVEGEAGRAFVFLERPGAGWKQKGAVLTLDGKMVFSRPFTAAELDVLERGLPLELGEWRLPAGDHRVALGILGQEPQEEAVLGVSRGAHTAWVATPTEAGVAWRAE